jgi:ElaB/YqjD/DUF883 family membrane-anchored ribosome-binding protein
MATDPVPEPLTNQKVSEEQRKTLNYNSAPNVPADVTEMPAALPPAEQNRTLNEAAAKIGRAAGKTTATVRELPRRTDNVSSTTKTAVSSKVEDIKDRVSQAADQAQQSVSEAYDRARTQANRSYNQARRQAADTVQSARFRIRHIMHEYPFHVIATAALMAFVAGVALRIWRSSRYE